MKEYTLVFKWSISRARDTYGYNICSLWVDRIKVTSCNGGGYDMQGTVLGNWISGAFETELLTLDKKYYGLTFHNPNYDPGKAIIDDKTVEEREESGESFGLERYQSFHKDSSPIPTKSHVIPLINGACGFSSVGDIINAIGYRLEHIHTTGNEAIYKLVHYKEK